MTACTSATMLGTPIGTFERPIHLLRSHRWGSRHSLVRLEPKSAGAPSESLRRPPSPAASTSSNPSLPLPYLYRRGMARGAFWCPRPHRSCHRRQATAAASSLPCLVSMTCGARMSARVISHPEVC
jgi:hypothetical protein